MAARILAIVAIGGLALTVGLLVVRGHYSTAVLVVLTAAAIMGD